MTNPEYIERYGNLLKKERLSTLSQKVLPNTFVLESSEPFPGFYNYYSQTPGQTSPLYVYLVTKIDVNLETLTRATQNIKKFFPKKFDAADCEININNEIYHAIRLRHLSSYDDIEEIQNVFIAEGIEMRKKPYKAIEGPAIIKLKKFFHLQELPDNIFLDVIEKDHGYFVLPKKMDWPEFKELTHKVKNNWESRYFDAAVGFLYIDFKIVDIVRIYNPQIDAKYIMEIRKKYYDFLSK